MYERAISKAVMAADVSVKGLYRLYQHTLWVKTAERKASIELPTGQLLAAIEHLFELREINRQYHSALEAVGIEYTPAFSVARLLTYIEGSLSRTAPDGVFYERTENFIQPHHDNTCYPPFEDNESSSTFAGRKCVEMHTDEEYKEISNWELIEIYEHERWRLTEQYATISIARTSRVLAVLERSFDLIEQNREMDEALVVAGYRFYPEVNLPELLTSIEEDYEDQRMKVWKARHLNGEVSEQVS